MSNNSMTVKIHSTKSVDRSRRAEKNGSYIQCGSVGGKSGQYKTQTRPSDNASVKRYGL